MSWVGVYVATPKNPVVVVARAMWADDRCIMGRRVVVLGYRGRCRCSWGGEEYRGVEQQQTGPLGIVIVVRAWCLSVLVLEMVREDVPSACPGYDRLQINRPSHVYVRG